MKFIFKQGDPEKKYQKFETISCNQTLDELRENHITNIVLAILYNQGSEHEQNHYFIGFHQKYGRPPDDDVIIIYFKGDNLLSIDSWRDYGMHYAKSLCYRSEIYWELQLEEMTTFTEEYMFERGQGFFPVVTPMTIKNSTIIIYDKGKSITGKELFEIIRKAKGNHA